MRADQIMKSKDCCLYFMDFKSIFSDISGTKVNWMTEVYSAVQDASGPKRSSKTGVGRRSHLRKIGCSLSSAHKSRYGVVRE